MDSKIGKNVQRVKEAVYKRTGTSGTGLKLKNADGGRYIRLCNGRCIVNGRRR